MLDKIIFMSAENPNLIQVVILITLIFFTIVLGLIFLVTLNNKRKKLFLKEKQLLHQKFESELLKTQIEVQEQTMQTIAADLHDNIGQLLSLTTLTLGSIQILDDEKAENKVASSLELVNRSIRELRELAKLLQGEQLIMNGLGNAIEQEINWLKRTQAYQLKVDNQLMAVEVSSPQKDLIILRLLQEIITNIIKHAQATTIAINTQLIEGNLQFTVIENGIGFDYEAIKNQRKGLGLYSINKRVEMINGEIVIDSAEQAGTKISIQIPYP